HPSRRSHYGKEKRCRGHRLKSWRLARYRGGSDSGSRTTRLGDERPSIESRALRPSCWTRRTIEDGRGRGSRAEDFNDLRDPIGEGHILRDEVIANPTARLVHQAFACRAAAAEWRRIAEERDEAHYFCSERIRRASSHRLSRAFHSQPFRSRASST